MTRGCSLIDPPPHEMWTQGDLPTQVARDWLRENPVDLEQIKADLKARWNEALGFPHPQPPAPMSDAERRSRSAGLYQFESGPDDPTAARNPRQP